VTSAPIPAAPHDLRLDDGRTLRVYDAGAPGAPGAPDALTVVWHHGSPQTGAPLAPVLAAARRRGMRHVSYARPGYGGSAPQPGRDVAAAARDTAAIADALGVARFAVMGASGGGPHALACAALLGPERVSGVVCLAGPAPYTADFDWFAGMQDPSGLRAARGGRAARDRHAETDAFDEQSFTTADWAALQARWGALAADATAAGSAGPDGLVDDDVALASPWGFDVGQIATRTLLVQGGEDRVIPPAHAHHLLAAIPTAELWLRPRDGHVSILDACPAAMDWLRASAAR
jgi:pimeloyl-ACP methyl ester carboxylesterase